LLSAQRRAWYAEWLNEHLTETEYTDSDGKPCRILIYYDKQLWLLIGKAFIFLSSASIVDSDMHSGIAKDLSKRRHPDWCMRIALVIKTSAFPIVIDATGEGDRWLPE